MTDSAAPRSPPAAGRAGIASAQCACYYPGQFISGRQPTLPTLPTKAARRERHQQLAPCALVAANVADCGIRGPLMLVFSNLLVNLAARPACLAGRRTEPHLRLLTTTPVVSRQAHHQRWVCM